MDLILKFIISASNKTFLVINHNQQPKKKIVTINCTQMININIRSTAPIILCRTRKQIEKLNEKLQENILFNKNLLIFK